MRENNILMKIKYKVKKIRFKLKKAKDEKYIFCKNQL